MSQSKFGGAVRQQPRRKVIDFEGRRNHAIKFFYSSQEEMLEFCELLGEKLGHPSPFQAWQNIDREKTASLVLRTRQLYEKAINMSNLKYKNNTLKFYPANATPMAIRVKNIPLSITDEDMKVFFSHYGEVTDIKHGRSRLPECKYLNGIENGDRIIFLLMTKEIPRLLQYRSCQFIVSYSGQSAYCNYCKSEGHLVKTCPKLHCQFCNEQGHNTNKCQFFTDCDLCKNVHPVNQCRTENPDLFSDNTSDLLEPGEIGEAEDFPREYVTNAPEQLLTQGTNRETYVTHEDSKIVDNWEILAPRKEKNNQEQINAEFDEFLNNLDTQSEELYHDLVVDIVNEVAKDILTCTVTEMLQHNKKNSPEKQIPVIEEKIMKEGQEMIENLNNVAHTSFSLEKEIEILTPCNDEKEESDSSDTELEKMEQLERFVTRNAEKTSSSSSDDIDIETSRAVSPPSFCEASYSEVVKRFPNSPIKNLQSTPKEQPKIYTSTPFPGNQRSSPNRAKPAVRKAISPIPLNKLKADSTIKKVAPLVKKPAKK